MELLCYLVVSAPARVRLHPSCFIGGEQKVQEFRRKAVEFGNLIGFVEQSLAWQIPEVHHGQPLVANLKLGDAESPVPLPRCEPPQPPPPGVADHVAVLDTLRHLQKNKEYVMQRIPWRVAGHLADHLPKDGLLQFLRQYPNLFKVTLTNRYNGKKPVFAFKVLANIDDEELWLAAPAIGGDSSSASCAPSSAPVVWGGSKCNVDTAEVVEAKRSSQRWGAFRASGTMKGRRQPAWGGSSIGGGAPNPPPHVAPPLVTPPVVAAVQQDAPGPAVGGAAATTPPLKQPLLVAPPDVAAMVPHPPPGLPPPVLQNAAPAPAPDRTALVLAPVGIPIGPASSWSINDMLKCLDVIKLGHLGDIIREYALDGKFFLQCAQQELHAVGIEYLQWRKIRMYICHSDKHWR